VRTQKFPAKKRKQAKSSLNNLQRGPVSRQKQTPELQTPEPARTSEHPQLKRNQFIRDGKVFAHTWTTMYHEYSRQNPSPAVLTKLDKLHDDSLEATL